MVIIQKVEIKWTKNSRGAPLSTIRNQIPNGYDLPFLLAVEIDAKEIGFHSVRCGESDNFKPHNERKFVITELTDNEFIIDCIKVVFEENEVLTYYKKDGYWKKVAKLQDGQWVQVLHNWRVGDWHGTVYHKYAWNIYHVYFNFFYTEKFMSTKPDFLFNDLVELW